MKFRNYSIRFLMLLVGVISVQTAFADVKIKTRRTMSGQTYEGATYIKGKRQRYEQKMGEIESVSITQCDLKRSIQLVPQAKTYMVQNWEVAESKTPTTTVTNTKVPSQKGGVVTMTNTIKDTGERKQMFGYTARHLIITMEMESSPDACSKTKMKMQTDGWYIDFGADMDCDYNGNGGYGGGQGGGGCQDRYVTKNLGSGKRGFALYEKTTMFDESGKETYTMLTEVVELSKATLDASLFDVPADYKEVADSSALYSGIGSQAIQNAGNENSDDNTTAANSGSNQTVRDVANSSIPTEVGAKVEGTVRIGVPTVKISATGEGMNQADLGAAIKNTFAGYLKGTNVELVGIEARLPEQIDAEAKEKECDFVLYTNVAHKKGGGMFGKVLGAMSETVAGRAYGSSDTVGKATQVTIMTAAAATGNVKAKDQITLEIKMVAPGGSQLVAKQFQAKAKANGEDIISPVVEQASQTVIASVSK